MDFLVFVISELNREGSYFFREVILGLLIKCSALLQLLTLVSKYFATSASCSHFLSNISRYDQGNLWSEHKI